MEQTDIEKAVAAALAAAKQTAPAGPTVLGGFGGAIAEVLGSKKALGTVLTAVGGVVGAKEFAHSNPMLAAVVACCGGAVVCCYLIAQGMVDAAKAGWSP